VAEAPSGNDAKRFELPRSVGITALAGVVLFTAFLLLTVGIPFLPGDMAHPWLATLTLAPVFGVFVSMSWRIWWRRREQVRTDAVQLVWSPRPQSHRTMCWANVVDIHEYPFRQRIELTDLSGQRIPLEYQLTGFGQLREIIRRNTPHLRERHVLIREFHRHAFLRWINVPVAVFFAGLAAAGALRGEAFAVAGGVGFVIFAAVGYARELRSVDVGPGALVLRRPIRSTEVPWREVRAVELLDVPGRAGPVQTVRIQVRDGKSIDLNMMAKGTIPLFDAVEARWRRARVEAP
jgi:hypothetical protein